MTFVRCDEHVINTIGETITIAGWVHRKRNHGDLLFIDLRDYDGIIQCRTDAKPELLAELSKVRPESVVKITGVVKARPEGTINEKIVTGSVEIDISEFTVMNPAEVLPFEVNGDSEFNVSEELRLEYRFLDLRRTEMVKNLKLRSAIIRHLRRSMEDLDFNDIQTPILTASSPEGARDYLVPSRLHPGKFYALPQAPQIFKQLLMASGVERYYQIAPCFRDEASRSDRLPGEFYQLDYEMAFATQEDVFAVGEQVLFDTFSKFTDKPINPPAWPRIPYKDSIEKYGNDKPDLRYRLEMKDVTHVLKDSTDCPPFMKEILDKGGVVRAIMVPNGEAVTARVGKDLNSFAQSLGMPGLGFMRVGVATWRNVCEAVPNSLYDEKINCGPLAKFFTDEMKGKLELETGSVLISSTLQQVIFFIVGMPDEVKKWGSVLRIEISKRLGYFEDGFAFCWITDFPMYELDEDGKVAFSHNPFSMPQGGHELGMAVFDQDPLTLKAYQYDIVCNGIELSSGAVRNHRVDMLLKAFSIAGYAEEEVRDKFRSLIKAFSYGCPPHAGMAPGVERIVMLLADTINVREVVAFPLNGKAECLLTGAPNLPTDKQIKELGLLKPKFK